MDSPYRPPQPENSSEFLSVPGQSGGFQPSPTDRHTIERLAKYLSDIGGFLVFVAIIAGLLLVVSAAGVAAGGIEAVGLELAQQLVTTVFLFLIGTSMRRAAKPLKAIVTEDGAFVANVTTSMRGFRALYNVLIGYTILGIATTAFLLSGLF